MQATFLFISVMAIASMASSPSSSPVPILCAPSPSPETYSFPDTVYLDWVLKNLNSKRTLKEVKKKKTFFFDRKGFSLNRSYLFAHFSMCKEESITVCIEERWEFSEMRALPMTFAQHEHLIQENSSALPVWDSSMPQFWFQSFQGCSSGWGAVILLPVLLPFSPGKDCILWLWARHTERPVARHCAERETNESLFCGVPGILSEEGKGNAWRELILWTPTKGFSPSSFHWW